MKIAVVPERYGRIFSPCASIRLAPFFDRIREDNADWQVRYLLLEEVEAWRPDVVVWHRVALPGVAQVEKLQGIARRIGSKTVYDLDDNLLDLAGHGEAHAYVGLRATVIHSIRMADEVWVSTPRLAGRVDEEAAKRVAVLPNALDPVLWTPLTKARMPQAGPPLSLVYMGTRTHGADLALLLEALDMVERTLPGSFRLTTIGVREQEVSARPWLTEIAPPDGTGPSYPAFVNWFKALPGFDLGVAPLLDSPFNRCKSAIKVLDYAAVGVPALASDVAPYADSLRSGLDCVLTENTADAWAEAIASVIKRPSALDVVRANLPGLVVPERFADAVDARVSRLLDLVNNQDSRPIEKVRTRND